MTGLAKNTAHGRTGKPRGRPPIVIDEAQLRALASINCTMAEMAAVLQCSVDTLERNYAEPIKALRESGRSSLRRAQWKAALSGDRTMLVWLGKNELGQKDKSAYEHTGKDGAPLVPQTIRFGDREIAF